MDRDTITNGYKKPPIVEAIIALHLERTIDGKIMDRYAARQKAPFPGKAVEWRAEIKAEAEKTPETRTIPSGVQLTSKDQNRIIIIKERQFAVIHLAPYHNWSALYDDTLEQWNKFTKVLKNASVKTVSTRFVNRIDIPVGDDEAPIPLNEYLNVGVSIPTHLDKMQLQNFHVHCSLNEFEKTYRCRLNVSSQNPSPLIDHISILLDIDVQSLKPLPIRTEALWLCVDELRAPKNRIFESCITNKTRELFR